MRIFSIFCIKSHTCNEGGVRIPKIASENERDYCTILLASKWKAAVHLQGWESGTPPNSEILVHNSKSDNTSTNSRPKLGHGEKQRTASLVQSTTVKRVEVKNRTLCTKHDVAVRVYGGNLATIASRLVAAITPLPPSVQ